MPYVYRYTDQNDDVVKYVGIIRVDTSFPARFQQHCYDEWNSCGDWLIEYIQVDTITDAESLEGHWIWYYGTGNYYNKAKVEWGKCSFAPDPDEYMWTVYSTGDLRPHKKAKSHEDIIKKRKAEENIRRILFDCNMQKLSRDTGILRSTLYNRKAEPGKTTVTELAQIVKARGLTAEEVMMVLRDCT